MDDLLPPAVPAYTVDIGELHARLGQATAYIAQLARELEDRAVQLNRMDDENQRLKAQVADLEAADSTQVRG